MDYQLNMEAIENDCDKKWFFIPVEYSYILRDYLQTFCGYFGIYNDI